MTGEQFERWLSSEGLPTHLLPTGRASSDPKKFARFLLKSPDSLRASQRKVLREVAEDASRDASRKGHSFYIQSSPRHGNVSAVLLDRQGRSINTINGGPDDSEAKVRAAAKRHWPGVKELNTSRDRGAEKEEWGPYSEYSVAQEKSMKLQAQGVRGLRIDKSKGKWLITGVKPAHAGRDPNKSGKEWEITYGSNVHGGSHKWVVRTEREKAKAISALDEKGEWYHVRELPPKHPASRDKEHKMKTSSRSKSARKYYVVDQVQSGLWHQVGRFSSKTSAEAFRQQVPGRSRVVYTYPSHDRPVLAANKTSRDKGKAEAIRYSGNLEIRLRYDDRTNSYPVAVYKNGKSIWKGNVRPAPAGFGRGVAYDSRRAFSKIAESALAFADHDRPGLGDDANHGERGFIIRTWKR